MVWMPMVTWWWLGGMVGLWHIVVLRRFDLPKQHIAKVHGIGGGFHRLDPACQDLCQKRSGVGVQLISYGVIWLGSEEISNFGGQNDRSNMELSERKWKSDPKPVALTFKHAPFSCCFLWGLRGLPCSEAPKSLPSWTPLPLGAMHKWTFP